MLIIIYDIQVQVHRVFVYKTKQIGKLTIKKSIEVMTFSFSVHMQKTQMGKSIVECARQ